MINPDVCIIAHPICKDQTEGFCVPVVDTDTRELKDERVKQTVVVASHRFLSQTPHLQQIA